MCFSCKGLRRCEVYEQNSEASIWRRFMYSRVSSSFCLSVCACVCMCAYGCVCVCAVLCCACETNIVRSISAPIADVCIRLIFVSFFFSLFFTSRFSSVRLLLIAVSAVCLYLSCSLSFSSSFSLFSLFLNLIVVVLRFSCVCAFALLCFAPN